jgi:hypothetical protein
MNSDGEKAAIAALKEGLANALRDCPPLEKCPQCGGPLLAVWKEGRVDQGEPFFFCGPCDARED